jgi:hypothetical protein
VPAPSGSWSPGSPSSWLAQLRGSPSTSPLQLRLTIIVVVVFALLSWYDADVSSRRSGVFAFASIVTSMYLLVTGLLKSWVLRPHLGDADDFSVVGRQFFEWIGLVAIARFALLHVHLLLVIHGRRPTALLRVVARATVGVIAVLAALLSFPLLVSDLDQPEALWRTVWVVVILDLLGTVVIPLSNALFSPRRADQPAAWTVQSAAPPSWSEAPPPAAGGPAPVDVERFVVDTAAPAPAPAAFVYEGHPEPQRVLAWPRYVDGTPLPTLADGSPDFSGVLRR